MAESKKRFAGAIGPSYTSRAKKFDCQETFNAYLEGDELGGGKGDEPAVLIKTPGNNPLVDVDGNIISIGTGPIRCLYTQSNQEISYVVSGNEVYQLSGINAIPVKLTGNLSTSTGPVDMDDNGIQLLFVDGQFGYGSVIGSETFALIVSDNFFPSDTVTYQDGYFILVQKGTQGFFISDINDITFPPLNEAFAQGSPDILIAAISNNRQLYLLGAKSTETYYNQGASASTPFVRQDGKFSQVGCAAAASVAVLGETFLWLGSNAQGGGIVYMLDNAMPTRVSTFPVEFSIQNAANLTNATGWSYQQEGHYFYLLNVPGLDFTWCYDLSNPIPAAGWTKRCTVINGVQQQLRVQTHCVLNDTHIVGDATTGSLYALDLDYYKDGFDDIYFIRQFPHSSNNLNLNFYNLLEIDFLMGTALPNQNVDHPFLNPPMPPFDFGSNPTNWLDYSFTEGFKVSSLPAVGQPVTFTSICSPTPDNIAYDFGDGNSESGTFDPVHTYNQSGTYWVSQSVDKPGIIPAYHLVWDDSNPGSETIINPIYIESEISWGKFHIDGIPLTSAADPDTDHTVIFTITCTPVGGSPAISPTYYRPAHPDFSAGNPSMQSQGTAFTGPYGNNGIFMTGGSDQFYHNPYLFTITATVDGHQVANTLTMQCTPSGTVPGPAGNSSAFVQYGLTETDGYAFPVQLNVAQQVTVAPSAPSAGSLPRVALYCSKDGGQTFGTPRYAYLGKIGQYKYRARWGPLGASRDMVFRVVCTEPVKLQMLSAYLDWDGGLS
jgi:PKD domain/Phage stabilisation protein